MLRELHSAKRAAGEAKESLVSLFFFFFYSNIKTECLVCYNKLFKGPRGEKKLVLEEQISVKQWIYGARFGPAAINEVYFTGRTRPRMAATEKINKKTEI